MRAERTQILWGWTVVALLVAGWFAHDAVLHLCLLIVPWLVGFEFGLPMLISRAIRPSLWSQATGLAFALLAAGVLSLYGIRRLRRSVGTSPRREPRTPGRGPVSGPKRARASRLLPGPWG